MICIYCGEKTKTTNSRPVKSGTETWRRKECKKCGAVFTTREHIDLSGTFRIRHQGKLTPLSRDNLYISVYRSLSHKPTAQDDASALTDTILQQLYLLASRGVISKDVVVHTTLETLKRFDEPAGVFYQAHYC